MMTILMVFLIIFIIYFIYNCISFESSYNYWKYCYKLTYDTYWLLNNNLIIKIYSEKLNDINYNMSEILFIDENNKTGTFNIIHFSQKIIRQSTKEEFEARVERNKILKELEKVK